MAEKEFFTNCKLCSSENTTFIVSSAKHSSCSKKMYVQKRKMYENGVFLCFLFLLFFCLGFVSVCLALFLFCCWIVVVFFLFWGVSSVFWLCCYICSCLFCLFALECFCYILFLFFFIVSFFLGGGVAFVLFFVFLGVV